MEEAGALGYSVQRTAIGESRQMLQGPRDVVVCMETAFGWMQAGTTAVSMIRKLFSFSQIPWAGSRRTGSREEEQ